MHAYRSDRESRILSAVLKLHSTWSAFCFAVAMGLAAAVLLPATRAEAFACDASQEGNACTTVGGCGGYISCMGTKTVCEVPPENDNGHCNENPIRCGDGMCNGKETGCSCPGDCAAMERNLINQYAPVWRFHLAESSMPSSVDWYLANTGMVYQYRDYPVRNVVTTGSLSRSNLATQSVWEPMGGMTSNSGFPLRSDVDFRLTSFGAGDDWLRAGNVTSAKTYVQAGWRPDPAFPANPYPAFIIQYWLFYPYSDNSPVGAHWGDWEHVSLIFNHLRNSAPAKVLYRSHDTTNESPWSDAWKLPNTQQFLTFVDLGSHASRRTPSSSANYADWKQLNAANRWEYFGDANGCIGDGSWTKYSGVWGPTDNVFIFGASPKSPYYQGSWMYE